MPSQKRTDPLWIVTFDNQKKASTWMERAHFVVPPPEPLYKVLSTPENQRIALDFLEKVSTSFRTMAENYIANLDRNEISSDDIQDIREKFDSLDQWIAWIRVWINGGIPPERPPQLEQDPEKD